MFVQNYGHMLSGKVSETSENSYFEQKLRLKPYFLAKLETLKNPYWWQKEGYTVCFWTKTRCFRKSHIFGEEANDLFSLTVLPRIGIFKNPSFLP